MESLLASVTGDEPNEIIIENNMVTFTLRISYHSVPNIMHTLLISTTHLRKFK